MIKPTYSIYTSVRELSDEWDNLKSDEFLNLAYLTAQENALSENMEIFYIAIFKDNKMVAKAIVQRVKIRGEEVMKGARTKIGEDLINLLNVNILCLGNLKLTGEHAYVYSSEIEEKTVVQLLMLAVEEIRKLSKKDKIPIQLMGFKDFYKDAKVNIQDTMKAYDAFTVQPNMVFEFNKAWKDFDDYLMDMRTKYRTRAKRAFKKAEDISFRELTLEQIIEWNQNIYPLYLNVLENTSFSFYTLPENYFIEMKKHMQHKFKLFAGFKDDELICFYTIIENHEQLEAGFLGYHEDMQREHQLYLNMLYKMIQYGIDFGFDKLEFSRTAMEIKSSVGAVPVETYGFLKHTHPLMNKVLRSTFGKFYQPEKWVQRNPFKDN